SGAVRSSWESGRKPTSTKNWPERNRERRMSGKRNGHGQFCSRTHRGRVSRESPPKVNCVWIPYGIDLERATSVFSVTWHPRLFGSDLPDKLGRASAVF